MTGLCLLDWQLPSFSSSDIRQRCNRAPIVSQVLQHDIALHLCEEKTPAFLLRIRRRQYTGSNGPMFMDELSAKKLHDETKQKINPCRKEWPAMSVNSTSSTLGSLRFGGSSMSAIRDIFSAYFFPALIALYCE